MPDAGKGLEPSGWKTQWCLTAGGPLVGLHVTRTTEAVRNAPFRPRPAQGRRDKIGEKLFDSPRIAIETLLSPARCVRSGEAIRQKIIGRRVVVGSCRIRSRRFRRGLSLVRTNRPLALLDEPARDHGVSVLVEPLVEQGRDFLAQVGGVAEARKLVAVQRVAGSGEQKLPRRLCAAGIHGDLQWRTS
jgi:hypothetical protein